MRAREFETPESSNVIRVAVGLDEDVVVVEYVSGTYAYDAEKEVRLDLIARLEAGESAGRSVIALLHPLPYRRIG